MFHLIDMPYCLQVSDRDRAYVAELFAKLISTEHSPDMTAPLLAKSIIFELVMFIVKQSMTQIQLSSSRQIDKLNDIVKYIDAHISEDLTLEHLAKIANYSPKYFIQLFKSMLNLTPFNMSTKRGSKKQNDCCLQPTSACPKLQSK